jgi:hypothetical protein
MRTFFLHTKVKKAAETTFIRKTHTLNVNEIDTCCSFHPELLFLSNSRLNYFPALLFHEVVLTFPFDLVKEQVDV